MGSDSPKHEMPPKNNTVIGYEEGVGEVLIVFSSCLFASLSSLFLRHSGGGGGMCPTRASGQKMIERTWIRLMAGLNMCVCAGGGVVLGCQTKDVHVMKET